MRAAVSLNSLGFDRNILNSGPILSAVASEKELQDRLNDIKKLCPGVDLSPEAVQTAMRFRARLAEQRRRVDATLRMWTMRAADIEALLPYYEEVMKIHEELRVMYPCLRLSYYSLKVSKEVTRTSAGQPKRRRAHTQDDIHNDPGDALDYDNNIPPLDDDGIPRVFLCSHFSFRVWLPA